MGPKGKAKMEKNWEGKPGRGESNCQTLSVFLTA